MTALFSSPPKIPAPDTSAQQRAEARADAQDKKLADEEKSRSSALAGRNRGRGLLVNRSTGDMGVQSNTLG